MRVLFVSGEVAPFTNSSEIATLVRVLPEKLHDSGRVETRIMMPRYGTVSERRNRLHEVIRLSGSDIIVDGEPEPLKVKVASIPGIRLQVYFMDSVRMFKRKGIFADRSGKTFEDNPKRATFFGRAVIRTISNLGWQPDVVHAFGWMAGMVPYLLRTEFADNPLFADSKIVYTPQSVDFDGSFTADVVESFRLTHDERLIGLDVAGVGRAFADSVMLPPSFEDEDGRERFGEDDEANMEMAAALYERVMSGVPA